MSGLSPITHHAPRFAGKYRLTGPQEELDRMQRELRKDARKKDYDLSVMTQNKGTRQSTLVVYTEEDAPELRGHYRLLRNHRLAVGRFKQQLERYGKKLAEKGLSDEEVTTLTSKYARENFPERPKTWTAFERNLDTVSAVNAESAWLAVADEGERFDFVEGMIREKQPKEADKPGVFRRAGLWVAGGAVLLASAFGLGRCTAPEDAVPQNPNPPVVVDEPTDDETDVTVIVEDPTPNPTPGPDLSEPEETIPDDTDVTPNPEPGPSDVDPETGETVGDDTVDNTVDDTVDGDEPAPDGDAGTDTETGGTPGTGDDTQAEDATGSDDADAVGNDTGADDVDETTDDAADDGPLVVDNRDPNRLNGLSYDQARALRQAENRDMGGPGQIDSDVQIVWENRHAPSPEYTVQNGDTLWDVAQAVIRMNQDAGLTFSENGIDAGETLTVVARLAEQNGIAEPDFILPGQQIRLDGVLSPQLYQ